MFLPKQIWKLLKKKILVIGTVPTVPGTESSRKPVPLKKGELRKDTLVLIIPPPGTGKK